MGRIAPHPSLITVQQILQHNHFLQIGSRCNDMLNQLRTALDAKVRFHTEEPLVAYLGLAYLRVVLFLLVLGRTSSADDRGIENDVFVDLKADYLSILIDQVTQQSHRIVTPHEMTNIAYHHFNRFRLFAEVDVDK
jgi:hypothetical protein